MEKKKSKNLRKRGVNRRMSSMYAGQDIYLAMVKKTQSAMRDLTMSKTELAAAKTKNQNKPGL